MSKQAVVPATPDTELTVGVLSKLLPTAIEFNSVAIAGGIIAFVTNAQKAQRLAEAAIVDDEDSAGRAADIIKVINTQLKDVERVRKDHTQKLDTAKDTFMRVFRGPTTTFTAAKDLLLGKVDRWRRAEQARLAEEARKAREEQERQAQEAAAMQRALGDEEGAESILEEAANYVPEAEKAVAVGQYGATLGSRSRKVGTVTDVRKFLAIAIKSKNPHLIEIVNSLQFSQTLLNRYAAQLLDTESKEDGEPALSASIPGFKAEVVETSNIR